MAELFLEEFLQHLQVYANSGPGRFGIPEVTQMDGLGFSLCAALLDIVRSYYFKVAWVRTTAGRTEVRCVLDQRGSEGLVSKRTELS